MNIINGWILAIAKKIENDINKKQQNTKIVELSNDDFNRLIKQHSITLMREIKETIQPPKWKIGKELYLNIYDYFSNYKLSELGKWDGGSKILLNYILTEERKNIPTVVIKDIVLDLTLFNDLVESYINFKATELDANYNAFKYGLKKYINLHYPKNEELCKNFGVYYCVYFKPKTFEFSPTWGLSEYSWLDPDTEVGQNIKRVWENVQSLNLDIKNYEQKIKNLELLINNLQKQL